MSHRDLKPANRPVASEDALARTGYLIAAPAIEAMQAVHLGRCDGYRRCGTSVHRCDSTGVRMAGAGGDVYLCPEHGGVVGAPGR